MHMCFKLLWVFSFSSYYASNKFCSQSQLFSVLKQNSMSTYAPTNKTIWVVTAGSVDSNAFYFNHLHISISNSKEHSHSDFIFGFKSRFSTRQILSHVWNLFFKMMIIFILKLCLHVILLVKDKYFTWQSIIDWNFPIKRIWWSFLNAT